MPSTNEFSSPVYAILKRYFDDPEIALKGKNCTIDSIVQVPGGHKVTFKWTRDDGTSVTNDMTVPDGSKISEIVFVSQDRDTETYKMVYDKGSAFESEHEFTIAKGFSPTVEPNENNHEHVFKLDITQKDATGGVITTTTDNIHGTDMDIEVHPEDPPNKYLYRLDISKFDGDTKTLLRTTPNLRGQSMEVEEDPDNTENTYKLDFKTIDGTNPPEILVTPNLHGQSLKFVEDPDNTENTYKLDITHIDGETQTTTITPNLHGQSLKFVEDPDNHEYVYKLDIHHIDGETDTVTITPNLRGKSTVIKPNENNTKFSYKLDIENIDGDLKEVITSPEMHGRKWMVGNEIERVKTEAGTYIDEVDVTIADTIDWDMYLSVVDNSTWKRIDTDTQKNHWVYQHTIMPKNNYELWIEIPEHAGKTQEEYQQWLRNTAVSVKQVWEKPYLYDEETELNMNYYYKVATQEYGPDSAWIDQMYPMPNQDYPVQQYSYNDGIKWLTFTPDIPIPAMSEAGTYEYFIEYDEHGQKGKVARKSVDTGFIEYPTGIYFSVTTSQEKPATAEQMMMANFIQEGRWVVTCYISESTKEKAFEYTTNAGQGLEGYVTVETWNSVIGTVPIYTSQQTVKGGINELNAKLQGLAHLNIKNPNYSNAVDAINKIDDEIGTVELHTVHKDTLRGGINELNDLTQGTNHTQIINPRYTNIVDAVNKLDDEKLDKVKDETTYAQAYIKKTDGTQTMYNVTTGAISQAVVQRRNEGQVIVPEQPTEDTDAVSKKYADEKDIEVKKLDTPEEGYYASYVVKQGDPKVAKGDTINIPKGITDWTAQTAYSAKDLVIRNLKIYRAKVKHTSSDDFNQDVADGKWDIIVPYDVPSWAASTKYTVKDLVKYDGDMFMCIEPHTSSDDFEADWKGNPPKWEVISGGAYLKKELKVTNEVGTAFFGTVYPVGTSLEDIITKMLTKVTVPVLSLSALTSPFTKLYEVNVDELFAAETFRTDIDYGESRDYDEKTGRLRYFKRQDEEEFAAITVGLDNPSTSTSLYYTNTYYESPVFKATEPLKLDIAVEGDFIDSEGKFDPCTVNTFNTYTFVNPTFYWAGATNDPALVREELYNAITTPAQSITKVQDNQVPTVAQGLTKILKHLQTSPNNICNYTVDQTSGGYMYIATPYKVTDIYDVGTGWKLEAWTKTNINVGGFTYELWISNLTVSENYNVQFSGTV